MSTSKQIDIMISSRCGSPIRKQDGSEATLSDLREELKEIIENETLLGKNIYDVWISEDPEDTSAESNLWDECLKHVQDCHIFLFLHTGEAGWAKHGADIGIVHAELKEALDNEPAKTFIIDLTKAFSPNENSSADENKWNEPYLKFITDNQRIHSKASNYEEAIDRARKTIVAATTKMVDLGKREARKTSFATVAALEWNRMNYTQRKKEIEKVISHQFTQRGAVNAGANSFVLKLDKGPEALFVYHGVPDAMSIPTARELVGQPFLQDHLHIKELVSTSLPKSKLSASGPIHLIGVYKGVTQSQARKQLGFPDAFITSTPFGIYVADEVQNIQMIFLQHCREAAETTLNVQRLLDWLIEARELPYLIRRSKSRRYIIDTIRAEVDKHI